MEELISIIIPVYKVEKYLPRCIESVAAQTYKNIEIILVDDGSPDRCPEICDEYAQKDSRITVIHKENGGLSDARNTGIEAAHGRYLGFVDSDDYIHPDMYQKLYEALLAEKTDAAVCGIERVDCTDYQIKRIEDKEVHVYTGLQAVRNILDKDLHVVSVIACGKLYKRSLFEQVRFPVRKLHEDEFTTYRVFYQCRKVVYLSGRYYYYFQRQNSIMGTRKYVFSYDGLEAYEQMADFFAGTGDMDLFYLIKYKYLYMLKEAAVRLKKSSDKSATGLAEKLDEKYRIEYKKYISKIQCCKRKLRLWLYRRLRISV